MTDKNKISVGKFGQIGLIGTILSLLILSPTQELMADSLEKDYLSATDLYKSGKYENAARSFKRLAGQYPHEFNVNFMVGASYFKLKQWSDALFYLDRSLKMNPRCLDCLTMSGIILISHQPSDTDKGVMLLETAEKMLEEDQMGKRLEVMNLLAYSYFSLSRYTETLEKCEAILKLKPDHKQALYYIAWCHKHLNGCDNALPHIRSFLKQNRENKDMLILAGMCLLQEKEFGEAETIGRHLRTKFPHLKEGYTITGQAMLFQHNHAYKEALTCFLKAVALDPEYAPAYYHAAQCFEAMKNFPEAKRYYVKALDMDSSQCEWHYKLGHINELLRSESKNNQNNTLKTMALKAYRQTMKLCPRHGPARERIRLLTAADEEQKQ